MRQNAVEIKDGKVDGNSFTFTVEFGMGDRTFSQTYKGTVTGDAMEGTITGGRGGDTPFKGARKKLYRRRAAGQWVGRPVCSPG